MKKTLLTMLSCLAIFSSWAVPYKDMEARFREPRNEDRPWVYWYWLNGNINEKGLIADLEAMHKAGIGTAMTFDIGIGVPGKVIVRSPEWYALMKSAILKADELGMQMGFNCPGWANAGGPWITPETAMKELTWSETFVQGGQKTPICLPQPPARMKFYRDIAVLAFPTLADDEFTLTAGNCEITDTLGHRVADAAKLFDNDRDTYAKLPGIFEVVLKEPQTIRSLQVRASAHADSRFFVADVWAWDEGAKRFVPVKHFPGSASGLNDRPGMGTASFEPIKSQRFRFGFKIGYGNTSNWSLEVYLQELNLQGGYRIPCWHNKTGFGHGEFHDYPVSASAADVVDPSKVINLTAKMRTDGTLDWTAPTGKWTIVRLGYIPTGAMSQPLNRGLNSLEVDKYSAEAAKVQYDNVMNPLYDLVGRDVARRVFSNYHVDSYEVGWQNWSEVLPAEFAARRGYKLEDYLVALTGRALKSVAETNAFLWDFRRTMADCYADNHVGYFTKRAHEDGIMFSVEAYDGPFEDLQTAGRTDMPMSEIWQNTNPDDRPRSAAMFAAHTYGRNRVGSEQYTGMGVWDLHPWKLKGLADASMAYGVNNFVMHVFTQQPWTDPKLTPGATLGPWGEHYDRSNTWFHESRPWHDYLSRCQYMLRQGTPVADILYFMGDNAPGGGGNVPVNPPYGFDGDAFNAEILAQMSVKDGLFVLATGKTYRYVVLPAHGEMTYASLQRIYNLAAAGGTVVGSRPRVSQAMCDQSRKAEFEALAAKLFGGGLKGKVYENRNIAEVIALENVPADFACADKKGLNLKYNHRSCDDAEIYFVSNISQTAAATVECRFRTTGLIPEAWNPMTGEREQIVAYADQNGITSVPLRFDQGETKFIVFRKPAPGESAARLKSVVYNGLDLLRNDAEGAFFRLKTQEGKNLLITTMPGDYTILPEQGKARTVRVKNSIPAPQDLGQDWNVAFEPRLLSPVPAGAQTAGAYSLVHFDALLDWSKAADSGIRYYSGTAIYTKQIEISDLSPKNHYLLDLGDVQVIAHVFVNGKDAGTLWKAPYAADITDLLRKGDNELRIEVTNLWPNRLIGDEQYPDDVTADRNWKSGELWQYPDWVWNEGSRPDPRRVTFTTYKHWKADSPLMPSGLVGPVRLIEAYTQTF